MLEVLHVLEVFTHVTANSFAGWVVFEAWDCSQLKGNWTVGGLPYMTAYDSLKSRTMPGTRLFWGHGNGVTTPVHQCVTPSGGVSNYPIRIPAWAVYRESDLRLRFYWGIDSPDCDTDFAVPAFTGFIARSSQCALDEGDSFTANSTACGINWSAASTTRWSSVVIEASPLDPVPPKTLRETRLPTKLMSPETGDTRPFRMSREFAETATREPTISLSPSMPTPEAASVSTSQTLSESRTPTSKSHSHTEAETDNPASNAQSLIDITPASPPSVGECFTLTGEAVRWGGVSGSVGVAGWAIASVALVGNVAWLLAFWKLHRANFGSAGADVVETGRIPGGQNIHQDQSGYMTNENPLVSEHDGLDGADGADLGFV